MDLGLEFGVWLGVGGLVVIWANLHLWHTRRVLNQLSQDSDIPEDSLLTQVVVEPRRPALAP
jgi:hypothetical protein